MDHVKLFTYLTYLSISLPLTVLVGRTLFRHGGTFLVDAFSGNREFAHATNSLLIVGFYLINCGWVAWTMTTRQVLATPEDGLEFLASRLGTVLLGLGALHFFNLLVLSRIRRRGLMQSAPPPVVPNEYLPPHPARDW